ncbi:MAG: metallophosphoesterase [Actinomycetes bacterium]|jgi:Icc-related predicted phosphoesterase|nr:MAG: metallophosphoesterase [Actinomycetota bacterium]
MLVVSDVHDSPHALARLVELGETIVILGDLANLADYRTGDGAVAEILGRETSIQSGRARGRGDFQGMRDVWLRAVGDRGIDVRREIDLVVTRQYRAMAEALQGGTGLVIHGNVDRPELLRKHLPEGFRFVHGEVVDMEGLSIGFVGGGLPTFLDEAGNTADEEFAELLAGMAGVDVLCTHVPPAIRPLRFDVITGREERGSVPLADFIRRHQPRLHLHGDVHQPQATTWRVGRTRVLNVGYFRATGRFIRVDRTGVTPGGLG